MRSLCLFVLGLLWGTSGQAQSTSRTSGADTRRIDLGAELAATPVEVRISPGLATLLLFDSPLERAGTTLEGREHFREVDVGERTIILIPSETARDKERFLLTVRFADGQAPASALFVLKAHPSLGDRQIEVYRQERPCEAYLQQAREQQAALDQCRQQLSRPSATPPAAPESLSKLFSSGLVGSDGIFVRKLQRASRESGAFTLVNLKSYRSEQRVVVYVNLRFTNPKNQLPWIVEGAKLINAQGKTLVTSPVRQSNPLESDGETRVWVEAETNDSTNAYTLTLWEKDGTRTVSMDNVRFP